VTVKADSGELHANSALKPSENYKWEFLEDWRNNQP